MKFRSLLAVFSGIIPLVAPLSSFAQGEAKVSMKVDLVAWGDTITGLTLKSEKSGEPVTAQPFRYSKPISYSGPAVLEIHQGKAAPATAEAAPTAAAATAPTPTNLATVLAERRKKDPTLVALAILPPASAHVTVLLAPGPSGTFQPYVIDDDPAKLPYGKLRIHNLSPMPIAMRCNNKAAQVLKTKESYVVPTQNKEVIYELAYQENGEWTTQENNIANVADEEQAQMVILKSDAAFFTSQDGSRAGFLQSVILRRSRNQGAAMPEFSQAQKDAMREASQAKEKEEERKANEARPKSR